MAATFYLVRHATHDWLARGFAGRQPDVLLNARGCSEAKELVARLDGVPLDAIYCSPQPRTRQTAQPLAAQRALDLRIDPAFDEVDLGEWEGRSFDEVRDQPAWRHWLAHRGSAQPPAGEPFAEVARRASAGLRRLALLHPGGHVMVVSNGDVLKAIEATFLGLPLDRVDRFDIAPASISILSLEQGDARLQLLNARGGPAG